MKLRNLALYVAIGSSVILGSNSSISNQAIKLRGAGLEQRIEQTPKTTSTGSKEWSYETRKALEQEYFNAKANLDLSEYEKINARLLFSFHL